jgi:subtilisin family serine protease
MKKITCLIFLSILLLLGGCEKTDNLVAPSNNSNTLSKASQVDPLGNYIVVLKDGISRVPDVAADIAKQNTAAIGFVYSHSIKGFSAQMLKSKADALAKDSRVKYIEDDRLITLSPIENNAANNKGSGKPSGQEPAQVTPWGIIAVGGPVNATGKTAWIIDTGIDLSNQDLNIDVNMSANFVPRGKSSPNDGNGHGTHVAGTIAAKNNSIDVVGVAAGATVVAVRVLDNSGSGYTSWVIAGVDYVAKNGANGDVANMSLGGGPDSALDDAVLAASKNVKFAIAAGNSSAYAGNYSPARVNGSNVYTISAYASNGSWASFSNYGYPDPVDYSCPGVSVLSLKAGGGTTTMSGTSMATPHMAGLLLIGTIHTDGDVLDSQGAKEPKAHH